MNHLEIAAKDRTTRAAWRKIGKNVKDIEHFRIQTSGGPRGENVAYTHVVFVVFHDGKAYHGVSRVNLFRDNYSRRIGFRIALGRALHHASTGEGVIVLDTNLEKLALRDHCRDIGPLLPTLRPREKELWKTKSKEQRKSRSTI